MIERKSIGKKRNHGKQSKPVHIKPSKYIDMVIAALESLKDRKGSIPKNIVGYLINTYEIPADPKSITSGVYRALKQGLGDEIILKSSFGHYNLASKSKRRKVLAKKRRKKRRGKKRGKKRKGRRRKKRRKGRKKGKKKGRRRRSRRRKSKKSRHRREREDSEEPRRRRRKKDIGDT